MEEQVEKSLDVSVLYFIPFFFFFLKHQGVFANAASAPLVCGTTVSSLSLPHPQAFSQSFPARAQTPLHFHYFSCSSLSQFKPGLLKLQLDIGVAFHYHQLHFLVYSKIIAIDCPPQHPTPPQYTHLPVSARQSYMHCIYGKLLIHGINSVVD